MRVPVTDLQRGARELPREAAHYLTRVHRLRPGDCVVLFDPEQAREARAELRSIGKSSATVQVEEPVRSTRLPSVETILVQCLPKGDKLDAIVRDATELGVTRILLARAERSVAELRNPAALQRLRKIALEAARQALRGDVPRIEEPTSWSETLRMANTPGRLCLHPEGRANWRKIPSFSALIGPVTLAIGPEGGFTEIELQAAREAGFELVALGSFVLRTETAAAAALGALCALRETLPAE